MHVNHPIFFFFIGPHQTYEDTAIYLSGGLREMEQDRTSLDLQGGNLLYSGDTDITNTG
jgi:hypothetical protein